MKKVALLVALGIAFAWPGVAGANSGQITDVSTDGAGHLTVQWALAAPSHSGGTVFANFLCIASSIDTTGASLSGCNGKWYTLPAFQAGTDTDYGSNGSFTTPDAFPEGQSYVASVLADDVYSFDSYVYYSDPNTSCSVDSNPFDPWLWICATGTDEWMPLYTFQLADTEPPTVPANVIATVGQSSAAITWTASSDNVGVVSYTIYRNGQPVGQTAGTSYVDSGLTANTQYAYSVTASDAAGNQSAQSQTSTITTPSPPPPPHQSVCTKVLLRKGYYSHKTVKGHEKKVWHKSVYRRTCH